MRGVPPQVGRRNMEKTDLTADYPQVWDTQRDYTAIMDFAEGYKKFLNQCKTERLAASRVVEMVRAAGFVDLDDLYSQGGSVHPGDRVYALRQNKAVALFVMGEQPVTQGMHIICSHLDAPRLDIRPNPLYEKEGVALLKTHYYGGIKKYQWAAIPLALHGVVVKKGGEHVQVSIGEDPGDPVFYISDLPKHLSAEQIKRSMEDGIKGEDLNIVFGSIPVPRGTENRVKENVLELLYQRYGITEKDFTSAELEIVPAGEARDAGIDRSMVVSYGHDDRVCAYAALQAILGIRQPTFTSAVFLVDKEEVGSQGGAGMNSRYMENLTAKLLHLAGEGDPMALRLALERSKMLSADVTLGYDTNHPEGFEPANTARIGHGPVLTKYAGHMGKKGCNDASAEYLAMIRDIFDDAGITWQTGEFGKIDFGGGGTIAPFAAAYGMEVLDCGVALLSMHAPWELASKADVYETSRAYAAFLGSSARMETYC